MIRSIVSPFASFPHRLPLSFVVQRGASFSASSTSVDSVFSPLNDQPPKSDSSHENQTLLGLMRKYGTSVYNIRFIMRSARNLGLVNDSIFSEAINRINTLNPSDAMLLFNTLRLSNPGEVSSQCYKSAFKIISSQPKEELSLSSRLISVEKLIRQANAAGVDITSSTSEIVNNYALANDLPKVDRYLKSIQAKNVPISLDPKHLSMIVSRWAVRGNESRLREYIKMVEPSSKQYAYTSLIDFLAKNGRFDEAMDLLENRMEEDGVRPTEISCSALFGGILKKVESEKNPDLYTAIDRCERILTFQRTRGLKYNSSTCGLYLSFLIQNGFFDRALNFWQSRRKIKLLTHCFVIQSLLHHLEKFNGGIDRVLELFGLVRKHHGELNFSAYTEVMKVLAKAGDFDALEALLSDRVKDSRKPLLESLKQISKATSIKSRDTQIKNFLKQIFPERFSLNEVPPSDAAIKATQPFVAKVLKEMRNFDEVRRKVIPTNSELVVTDK